MRRILGRFIEWLITYEHIVIVEKDSDIPESSYIGDAGYDLRVGCNISIRPGQIVEVPTSLKVDPKSQIWLEIKARSSTFKKRHLEVQDAVIDRGYRGSFFCVVFNPNGHEVHLKRGERIAQVVPHRLIPVKFVEGKLSKSARGEGGFGSSGR